MARKTQKYPPSQTPSGVVGLFVSGHKKRDERRAAKILAQMQAPLELEAPPGVPEAVPEPKIEEKITETSNQTKTKMRIRPQQIQKTGQTHRAPQVDALLDFVAKNDVPVFPASGKKGIIRPQNASKNPGTIISWFDWPEHRDVGMPTGYRSGIVVIDCDVAKDVDDRPILDENGQNIKRNNGVLQFDELCRKHGGISPVYQDMPSGGRHYFYRYDKKTCADIKNRTKLHLGGKLLNIDVKSDNGCIRIASLAEYPLHGSLKDVPELPKWLLEGLLNFKNTVPAPSDDLWEIESAKIEMAKAEQGERNKTLNLLSYHLGRRFAQSKALKETIFGEMVDAATAAGLSREEAERTCRSGLESGYRKGGYISRKDVPFFIRDKQIEADSGDYVENRDPLLSESDAPLGRLPDPPIDEMPAPIRKLCKDIATGKQIPLEMSFTLILALASACIGRSRGLLYNASTNWVEHANLYFLSIAESGTGKSHAFSYVFQYLTKAEVEHKAKWKEAQKKYQDDMKVWEKKKEGAAPKKPRNIQYLLDDTTIEAMVERLEDNPRGLFWYVDEMSGFFKSLDRYNKNSSGDGKRKLLSAWDSKNISSTRKSQQGIAQEVYIVKGTVGMFGNIQPELLPQLFSQDDVAQGLPQRFLFIRSRLFAPPVYPLPEIDRENNVLLERITKKLLGLEMTVDSTGFLDGINVTLSDAAKEAIGDYQNNLGSKYFYGDEKHFATYTAKLTRIVLRLALILHYLEWAISEDYASAEPEISYGTAMLAIQVTDWFCTHAMRMQFILPKIGGRNKRVDPSTASMRIARLVLDHESEIMELDGKIPNNVWKHWMDDAEIVIEKSALASALKDLHIELWRTGQQRGKDIGPKAIAYCKAMESTTQSMIEEASAEDNGDAEDAVKAAEIVGLTPEISPETSEEVFTNTPETSFEE